MKKTVLVVLTTLVVVLVCISCEKKSESYGENSDSITDEAMVYSDSSNVTTSSAATLAIKGKQFKKTADLKMEVKNVYQTATEIEKELSDLQGYVTHSKIEQVETETQTFAKSKDSANEVTKSYYTAEMTLKVPQKNLGQFLFGLGKKFTKLKYRTIDAEDVSLEYVYHDLQHQTKIDEKNRLKHSLQKGGKLPDEVDVIKSISENESDKNYAKVTKLKLDNEVKYSTVTLYLQDPIQAHVRSVVNWETHQSSYEPSIWYKMGDSLHFGYTILEQIILLLCTLWPFILIGIAVFFGIQWFRKKKRIV